MDAQIYLKRSSLVPEAPALKRWRSQAGWVVDGMVTPATAGAAAEGNDLSMQTMRDLKTSYFKVEDGLLSQEPTSVLDLQTSPGRSSSSSVSLSSQPSFSGEDTSFSARNGSENCSDGRNSGKLVQGSTGSASAQPDQDIAASWMDCMEDPDGPLSLPDFEECEVGDDHSSPLKLEGALDDEIGFANADIDFGFGLSLHGNDEHESFPSFPVSTSLMSDMLADPDMCLMDEPKSILLPEGFQDAQRLQELDESLSAMLTSTNGSRPGISEAPQGVVPTKELIRLMGPQSSVRQGSETGTQGAAAVRQSRSQACSGAPGRQGQGHNRSESWGSSQAHSQQQQQPADDSGLHLVHLLLACAEAIDESDFDTARPMLSRLRTFSNPYGDPMQRIALYFADALSNRLDTEKKLVFSAENPLEPAAAIPQRPVLESELAFQAFYQVLPFAKFAHFTANQAIYEAVECSNKIHLVDLDIRQGLQWPSLIQSLAIRPGGPPHLRITAVGTNVAALKLTERRLTECAEAFRVPFEFTSVVERVENLNSDLLRIAPDEALAINCSQVLHTFSGNPLALEKILSLFHNLNPVVVALLEVEANHSGPSLISRFVEALHYYCALFDSLEGSLGRDHPDRFRIENTTFAAEIKDIVAMEGTNRRARHVKFEAWQTHFMKAGFRALPISSYAVQQAQLLLELYTVGEMPYKLSEEFSALILGWQDTPVVAVSSWSC